MRTKSGFTLVELLIVVVIGVILIAVMLPTIKYSIDEGKLREGSRQLNAYFAAAKARAMASGRPSGVWLELERIGDPSASPGLYQCSQLYQADVGPAYTGDVAGAKCFVAIQNPPWAIDFQNTAASLLTLVDEGGLFQIRLDNKSHWYTAQRTSAGFEILPDHGQDGQPGRRGIDDNSNGTIDDIMETGWIGSDDGPRPPKVPSFGGDQKAGVAGVDDDSNGITDDISEAGWPGSDDVPLIAYSYAIRFPAKTQGKSFELPRGIVIDMQYSGIGADGYQLRNATGHVLVMFSPAGRVAGVSYVDATGSTVEDVGVSQLHLLVGRTEHVEYAWQNVRTSNIADGSNLWITVNRRTGSVGTIDNSPNVNLPTGSAVERSAYLSTAREFATQGDVKSGN